MAIDTELLEVGRTDGAYGVRGSVRVVPFEGGEVLAVAKRWFIKPLRGEVKEVTVKSVRVHGTRLLADIEGICSKEEADALRGRICVLREDFPEAEDDEHWAVDVIGCKVVNQDGVELGEVTDIGDNTVQDILKVEHGPKIDGHNPIYLIPIVEAYIVEIDTDKRLVTVDWQPEWL